MKKLERSLSLKNILVIGFSAMLGTGIFVTPGVIYSSTGGSIFLAYLLGGLFSIPAAMAMSELATSMPVSGGIYAYSERTFGPFIGTVVGFGLWLSLLFKSAFALLGFGEYLQIFTNLPSLWAGLIALLMVTLLNISGAGKVAGMIAYVVAACLLVVGATSVLTINDVSIENLTPFFRKGFNGFMVAISIGVGAFAGLIKLSAIAEEVKNPEVNLSKGILLSLFGVGAVYVSVSFILASSLDHLALKEDFKPLYSLAGQAMGDWGGKGLAIVAILTLVSMANAGILAASRFPFAMSRDHLFPTFFGKISPRFLTPVRSILLSGILTCLIVLTLDVVKVAKLASIFIIMMFLLVNLTVIVLREASPQWYTPKYKMPLYPFLPLSGILGGIVLLLYMGSLTVMSFILVLIPSLIIYLFYGKSVERKGVVGIRGVRKDLLDDTQTTRKRAWPEELELAHKAKIVIPLFGYEFSAETLVEVGTIISEGERIEVAYIFEIPEQSELGDFEDPPFLRALKRRIHLMAEEKKTPLTFDPVVTHDITKTLFEIGQRVHCHWLLVEWGHLKRKKSSYQEPLGWIKDHLHCHLAWYADKGVRHFKKVLLILKGNENDQLVFEVARLFIKRGDIVLSIVFENDSIGNLHMNQTEDAMREILNAKEVQRFSTSVVDYDKELNKIIELSVDHDLLIFGREKSTTLEDFFGSRDSKLLEKSACSALYLHSSS